MPIAIGWHNKWYSWCCMQLLASSSAGQRTSHPLCTGATGRRGLLIQVATYMHVIPNLALQEVGSKQSLAIHCCTFVLTYEALDEPPQRLAAAAAALDMPPQGFVALQHGSSMQSGTASSSDCKLLIQDVFKVS